MNCSSSLWGANEVQWSPNWHILRIVYQISKSLSSNSVATWVWLMTTSDEFITITRSKILENKVGTAGHDLLNNCVPKNVTILDGRLYLIGSLNGCFVDSELQE